MRITHALVGIWLTSLLGLASCDSGDDVEQLTNNNLTDSTGLVMPLDLFLSGTLDGLDFNLQNRRDDYFSAVTASQNGLCDTNLLDTVSAYIDVETMIMHVPTQYERSFFIDFATCIIADSLIQERLDARFPVGLYDYLNLSDSAGGVQIRYIDDLGNTWSSIRGPNNGTLSFFKLNGIIPNTIDPHSKYIAFGEFSCVLYKSNGEQMELRQARYKLHLGKL